MSGILERMAQRGRDTSRTSESSTPGQAADAVLNDAVLNDAPAPVWVRANALMAHYVDQFRKDGNPTTRRAAIIFQRLFEEAMEEAAGIPPEFVELYLKRGAAEMYWAATGMTIENIPLTAEFWDAVGYASPQLPEVSRDRYQEIEVKP